MGSQVKYDGKKNAKTIRRHWDETFRLYHRLWPPYMWAKYL